MKKVWLSAWTEIERMLNAYVLNGQKEILSHHKRFQITRQKNKMSNQNTSYYTVYKYNYQYNITMPFFCCKCVSEKKII